MWTGIEQQGATEMLNEPQVPAPVKKDPSGVSRLEHARMARTTASLSATGGWARQYKRCRMAF